jgi:gas vesicle protein
MKDKEKVLVAFLVGATAGVVTGLLFAPFKGSEARKKIADSASHLAEDIMDTAEEGLCALKDLSEKFITTAGTNGNGNGHAH